MSTVKQGTLTASGEWARHLRPPGQACLLEGRAASY